MNKTAIFPGSFDPLTLGHYDIINRASGLFDKLYVAIGINSSKPRLFPIDVCLTMMHEAFSSQKNIEIIQYSNLTVDLCRQLHAKYIVRGIRNVSDFEYERSLAEANRKLHPDIETVFFDSKPEYLPISSTITRDILRNGGDISAFVPAEILPVIRNFIEKGL